jgi:hypothetical protein
LSARWAEYDLAFDQFPRVLGWANSGPSARDSSRHSRRWRREV